MSKHIDENATCLPGWIKAIRQLLEDWADEAARTVGDSESCFAQDVRSSYFPDALAEIERLRNIIAGGERPHE
jgi:hypothetical protein